MRTSSAKAKGRRLCQEAKQMMFNFAEGLTEDDIIIMPASVPGSDLRLSAKAKKFYPFNVECKNQEKLNIWASIAQAEARMQMDEIPLVVFGRNRSKVYCALEFEAFLSLLKAGTYGFRRD
jgi:hypothetical protein